MIEPVLQSGAIPYRRINGRCEILILRKHTSRRWGIPKGHVEPNLTFQQNAEKEAWEEAGVRGEIGYPLIGSYRALKRDAGCLLLIEVWVYYLHVMSCYRDWPERHKRAVRWCPAQEAAMVLRKPLLKAACLALEKGVDTGSV